MQGWVLQSESTDVERVAIKIPNAGVFKVKRENIQITADKFSYKDFLSPTLSEEQEILRLIASDPLISDLQRDELTHNRTFLLSSGTTLKIIFSRFFKISLEKANGCEVYRENYIPFDPNLISQTSNFIRTPSQSIPKLKVFNPENVACKSKDNLDSDYSDCSLEVFYDELLRCCPPSLVNYLKFIDSHGVDCYKINRENHHTTVIQLAVF